jgi:hypothetical protein
MEFTRENTEILIVNYNTPDFIIDLHSQIREMVDNEITINIVDGSDDKLINRGVEFIELNSKMKNLLNNDEYSNHYELGYNIHHGPGMDYGLKKIQKKYVLILDSDIILTKNGLLELFSMYYEKDIFCIGSVEKVNEDGINISNGNVSYVHPRCMMIDKEFYMNFKTPFIKHGAPCINFMIKINKNNIINITELSSYVNHISRGTVKLFGYNI